MEIFDVINENDEVIGQATRQECHSDPKLLHRTVHFTLYDQKNRKFLITRRSPKLKFYPGAWCFMGEHMHAGEDYPSAVFRGVKEELGFSAGGCGEMGNHIFAYDQQRELVRFFLVDYEGEKLQPAEDEIVDYKWITFEELRARKAEFSDMTQYWIDHAAWESNRSIIPSVP